MEGFLEEEFPYEECRMGVECFAVLAVDSLVPSPSQLASLAAHPPPPTWEFIPLENHI
jgi:hypothetical protein